MAKKRIREQFDAVYQSGDEQAIKKMLKRNPWLREERKASMDASMTKQNQVLVALGVMEDELGGSVPIDEIVFSLRVDFKREANGWSLTKEGGKICDEFLNKNLGKFNL